MDLQETWWEGLYQIYVVVDRVKWRNFVNMNIDIVIQNAGKCLAI
jgi:hypothetical protein